MKIRTHPIIQAAVFGAFTFIAVSASIFGQDAKASTDGYKLPLDLAMEAALEAVKACEANGYRVTATIVDVAGYVKVQAKGDKSTIHTKDSSYEKAYTIVTMGPVFDLDTTAAFADMLNKAKASNPSVTAVARIPSILALAGGVAIKGHGEIIAGLGVGGAPGGKRDEVCALAGIEKISDRLPR